MAALERLPAEAGRVMVAVDWSAIVSVIIAGAVVAVPAYLAWKDKTARVLWPVVLACCAAGLIARLPDVELFELGPLKARMRQETERAKEAADKAMATVEQLRQLAVALARPTLGAVMAEGRFVARDQRRQDLETLGNVVAQLQALGVTPAQIATATEVFDKYLYIDLVIDLLNVVRKRFPEEAKVSGPCLNRLVEDNSSFQKQGGARACLTGAVPITGDVSESLADVEQFQKDRTLRRRDTYTNGPNP